jgi:hypothetical protein
MQDQNGNILRDANGDPVGWEWFRAYADGFSGWLPVNAIYRGGQSGYWHNPGSDAGGWLGKAPESSPQPEETTGPTEVISGPYVEPSADPCAGRKGALEFDGFRTRPYPDGTRTAREHITFRHINLNHNIDASKYVFQPVALYQRTDALAETYKMRIVEQIDNFTFQNATGVPSGTSILYVYAFPDRPKNPPSRTQTMEPAAVGLTLPGGPLRPLPAVITNVNTLVVSSDCQTVITSYPGLPAGWGRFDPRVTGTPQYWPRAMGPW